MGRTNERNRGELCLTGVQYGLRPQNKYFLIHTDLHELVVNADIGQEHRETSLELVELANRRLVLSQGW